MGIHGKENAMAPVNLSNVNITIQQFQEISSGKYNAGEVKLKNSHGLKGSSSFQMGVGRRPLAICRRPAV